MGQEKKQKTQKGHEIPVPKRADFEKVLDPIAKPKKPSVTIRRLTL